MIGDSPTERPSDTIVSIAAASNGVGLSFYRGATLPDPHGILLGAGAQNRFVRLPSAAVLDDPKVAALIDAAERLGAPKKQRPRRLGAASPRSRR